MGDTKLAVETVATVSVPEAGFILASDTPRLSTDVKLGASISVAVAAALATSGEDGFSFEPWLLPEKFRIDEGCDMLWNNPIGLDAQPLNHTRLPTAQKQRARDKFWFGLLRKCLNGDLLNGNIATHFWLGNFLFIITLHNNSFTARAIHFDRLDGAV